MIQGKTIVAIVPARGGSKQLPGKNTRSCHGRPLIVWTIEAGLQAKCVDRVIVSTDSPIIAEAASKEGADVPFLRPAELATDEAETALVVVHALEWLKANQRQSYDIVVLLQPTSPLRTAADVDGGVEAFVLSEGANSLVSVSEPPTPPYWMYTTGGDGFLTPVFEGDYARRRRQDLPRTYALNGALYVNRADRFLRSRVFLDQPIACYVMNWCSSIDIDTQEDFELAEWLMLRRLSSFQA